MTDLTKLRENYRIAADHYLAARDACDVARDALDDAIKSTKQHLVGTTIILTSGKRMRVDRVNAVAGKAYANGPVEIGGGGWSKRSHTVSLKD